MDTYVVGRLQLQKTVISLLSILPPFLKQNVLFSEREIVRSRVVIIAVQLLRG